MTEQIDLAVADDGHSGGVPSVSSAAPPKKSALDEKINGVFGGAVVRKDLVKAVKGNAIVPSFVLEYLLGQYGGIVNTCGSACFRRPPFQLIRSVPSPPTG